MHEQVFRRKITPRERLFHRTPHVYVKMMVKFSHIMDKNPIENAISKLVEVHPLLRIKLVEDEDHNLWFSSKNVLTPKIIVKTISNGEDCINVIEEEYKKPFDLSKGPLIRFLLLQSSTQSNFLIICHHIICDGMSLAYFLEDLLTLIDDDSAELRPYDESPLLELTNIPVKMNFLKKRFISFFINRYNKKWSKDPYYFDEEDYKNIYEAYWKNYTHIMVSNELSIDETQHLIEECRKNNVTVNSAIITATLKARAEIIGRKKSFTLGQPVNVRKELIKPVDRQFGLYVAGFEYKLTLDPNMTFWKSVKDIHQKISKLLKFDKIFEKFIVVSMFNGSLFDALAFFYYSKFIDDNYTRYKKFQEIKHDTNHMAHSLGKSMMSEQDTIITNLGRTGVKGNYSKFNLDSIIFLPGGGETCELTVGVITCADKLSFSIESVEKRINKKNLTKINQRIREILTTSN